ncbi:VCBS repeat-containing protein [Neolewinella aurantiaca]|uniref:VCBS repeat-containing protein n=1 Tax=Neolewinella aurantiaca TaxID=2602767 RepID=A0A5C7FYU1_9BACT|nr:VCBS repeat-containing protein [Neolewinella aurantiaca]TXF90849.1 VCBS repeat-containing protein [Neolewinella aurantiaca]
MRLITGSLVALLFICVACGETEPHTVNDLENSLGRRSAGAMNGDEEPGFLGACSSCHALPSPGDLPYGIWDTVVLPRMGHFLGRFQPGERDQLLSADPAGRQNLLAANVYPAQPIVDDIDWQRIRDHYLTNAPQELPVSAESPATTTVQFTARFPKLFMSPPSGSFIRIPKDGGVMMADINKGALYRFDKKLEAVQQLPAAGGLTDLTGNVGITIGSFSPTDAGTGELLRLGANGTDTLATGLRRPTSLLRINTDDDPEQEIIVTEYGKWTGRLSLFDPTPSGSYTASVLAQRPGALKVLPGFGGEAPSVFVLFGQGREQVVKYTFDKGNIVTKVMLDFPPSYGSVNLRWANWNDDPYPDLIYINGDNADYVSQPKPYHGIRIFAGTESGVFEEALFLPLAGAYDAVVEDFDGDGDRDIAAISFFPDYENDTPAAAVFYEHNAAGGFTAQHLPAAGKGRWLRLSVGDYDQDGDPDLAACSLAMETAKDRGEIARWITGGLPFIVWENNSASD